MQQVRYICDGGIAMHRASVIEPPGFASLSKVEQIAYVQRLWDLISKRPEQIPVPESHIDLVEARLQEFRANPNDFSDAFDVLDRLGKKAR